ncbi:MAG: ABC transporter ATP-binding protein [Chlorogloea purpurea SAG 13.99]|nr:ABC transporter ATP-binding protein [Chlorogloea purpurea SAG 13.99]
MTVIGSILEIGSTYLVFPLIQLLGGNPASPALSKSFSLARITDFYTFVPHRWQLLSILIALLGITIIKNLSLYLSMLSINNFTISCGNALREKCIERLLRMEIGFYNRTSLGKLLSYVNEQTQRTEKLFSGYLEIAREVVLITFISGFLLFLSPILTLATVISLIVIVGSLKFIIRNIEIHGYQSAKAIEGFSALIAEIITGMRVIKSFNAESKELARAKQSLQERYITEFTGYKYLSSIAPLTETAGILLLLLIIGSGVYIVAPYHEISLPVLLTYTVALMRILPRVNHLNGLRSTQSLFMGSFKEIQNFLNETAAEYLVDGTYEYQQLQKNIVFENLTFSYPDSKEATLNNINLEIKKGTTVALVGSSGSGKSTLADLIMRFYDPDKGQILIDGINLSRLTLRSWRRRIAMVSQDPFLFNASVRENIIYGRPDATNTELSAAVEQAYADEFIGDLPEGFNTIVGNRGTKLSGGQRQRIAIARAILCNPDILILDEATSALDSHSEKIVQKAIEEVSRARTVIMIAHRLSTIEKADKIVVLDRGRIVEEGNHKELLALKRSYYSLYKSQISLHNTIA